MQKGVQYWETYALVASWNLIHLLLTFIAVHQWHTRQLVFVLAFPQAPVCQKIDLNENSRRFWIGSREFWWLCTKVLQEQHIQPKAGWPSLDQIPFVDKSNQGIEICWIKYWQMYILPWKHNVYVLYTDNYILAGPNEDEIDQIIKEM